MKLDGIEIPISEAIRQENLKANTKYGDTYTNEVWLSVLTEEVGEVAHALNELYLHPDNKSNIIDNLKYELIQVSSVSFRWLSQISREEKTPSGSKGESNSTGVSEGN